VASLRELRERKFLTQGELAQQVGVHSTMVSAWERGLSRPSLRHLKTLCEVLEITPSEIDWPARRGEQPRRPSEEDDAGILAAPATV
jgi:transcriptional regulator with XRE-family HTH domain